MSYVQAAVLGAIQGLTEFLPISSDGHLFIARQLLGWPDQGLLFDAVLHLGTLVAVVIALWPEWLRFGRGLVSIVTQRKLWANAEQRLVVLVVVATIPAVLAGYFGESLVASTFRGVEWVAFWFAVTGAFYLLAEAISSWNPSRRTRSEPSRLGALLIGIAQAAALLPGVSRSGLTISTGRLHGLSREAAAKFSFVMSGPIVLGAVLKSFLDLRSEPVGSVEWGPLLLGIVVAGVVGVLAVRWLLRYLKTRNLVPFAAYLLVLSVLLLVLRP